MPDNVYSAAMTLDGSQYLATNARLEAATVQITVALARLGVVFAQMANAMKPAAAMGAGVQKQFEAIRASSLGVAAATSPAVVGLSNTARAMAGLADDDSTRGLRQMEAALSAIAERAENAGIAIEGVGQEAAQVNAPVETSEAPERSEAESPSEPGGHEGHSGLGVALGAALGGGKQVEGLEQVVAEEKKVEAATERMAEALTESTRAQAAGAEAAQAHSQALDHAARSHTAVAASAEHAAASTSHAAREGHGAATAAHHLAEETRDAAVGFRGLGESAAKAGELIRDMLVAVPEVAALVAVFASVEEVVTKVRESFEYGDKLNALSRQTGESAESIAKLRRTFEYFDVSADAVGTTLFMLQKSLGGVSEEGEPTAAAFARIGLSIADLKKMDAASQFAEIQKGLQTLPDQATRASVAMKIFSRSALEVQSILNASPADFAESMSAAADYAEVMGKNADLFEEVERKFFIFRENIETIFARIASGLAPAVDALLAAVNKVDFSKWGKDLTVVMTILTNAFSDGKVGELMGASLKLGFIDAINTVTAGFYGLAAAMTQFFGNVLPTEVESAFAVLSNPGFWKGIGELVLGAFLSIQGRLNQIFVGIGVLFQSLLEYAVNSLVNHPGLRTVLEALASSIPGAAPAVEALSNLAPAQRSLTDIEKANATAAAPLYQGFGQDAAKGDQSTQAGVKDITNAVKNPIANVIASLQTLVATTTAAFKNAPNAIDPTGAVDKLRGILAELYKAVPDEAVTPKPGVGIPDHSALDYKLPQGDRLSRVGLFVGGSTATPGLTEAKRTAVATERTAKSVEQLFASMTIMGSRQHPGAVYH